MKPVQRLIIVIILSHLPLWAAPSNALVDGFNDLGFDLLRRQVQIHGKTNILISPASLAFDLALLQQGADAQSERELNTLLHLNGLSKEALRTQAHDLWNSLVSTQGLPAFRLQNFQLDIAESVWIDHRVTVQAPFLSLAQNDFHADINSIDFASPEATGKINAWVAQKTHGKIQSINCPSSHEGKFPIALLNAVYFRDNWQDKFEPKNTRRESFHGAIKTTKPELMHSLGDHSYAEVSGSREVSLLYFNGRISMDLFLPKRVGGLDKLIAHANRKWFSEFNRKLNSERLDLRIPKLEFSDDHDLTADLKALGLHHATNPNANAFPEMAQSTSLETVEQKTYIKVDENGAEAAAATEVVTMAAGLRLLDPERVTEIAFNRPFLFTIRDRTTGLILFLGAIWDLPDAP